jgi:hypothetical protein
MGRLSPVGEEANWGASSLPAECESTYSRRICCTFPGMRQREKEKTQTSKRRIILSGKPRTANSENHGQTISWRLSETGPENVWKPLVLVRLSRYERALSNANGSIGRLDSAGVGKAIA